METETRKSKAKLIITVCSLILVGLLLRKLGLVEILNVNNISEIEAWIKMFGIWGPIVYIGLYIMASVFLIPGLPLTLLAPLLFGPTKGIILSSLGSTLGGTAAFTLARYAARDIIEEKFGSSQQFRKIDQGVKDNGWKMLVITRTVPLFPYNVQNYIYGLTKINLGVYMLVSWVTMLPATAACCCGTEAIMSGVSPQHNLLYLSAVGVGIVILFLLPSWVKENLL